MKITDKELQEAIDSKMRQRDIAIKFQMSPSSVCRRTQLLGKPKKKRGPKEAVFTRSAPSIPYMGTRGPNVPVGRRFDLKRGDKIKVRGEICKVGIVSRWVFQVIHNGVGGKVPYAYQKKDYIYRLESIERC